MSDFLVDESTGRKFFELLLKNGFNAKFVGNISRSVSDQVVLFLAAKEQRILITDDKDFGELSFRKKRKSHGIILFRTMTSNAELRFKLFKAAIEKKQNPMDWIYFFVIDLSNPPPLKNSLFDTYNKVISSLLSYSKIIQDKNSGGR